MSLAGHTSSGARCLCMYPLNQFRALSKQFEVSLIHNLYVPKMRFGERR